MKLFDRFWSWFNNDLNDSEKEFKCENPTLIVVGEEEQILVHMDRLSLLSARIPEQHIRRKDVGGLEYLNKTFKRWRKAYQEQLDAIDQISEQSEDIVARLRYRGVIRRLEKAQSRVRHLLRCIAMPTWSIDTRALIRTKKSTILLRVDDPDSINR